MIRRSGNFGFVDNGAGEIYTFSMNAKGRGFTPSTFMLRGGSIASFGYKYMKDKLFLTEGVNNSKSGGGSATFKRSN